MSIEPGTRSPELVVVTGATGALGRPVVNHFVQRGAEVAALDRPGDLLDDLRGHPGIHPVAADLGDRSAAAAAWDRIDEIGTPAAVVTLAGGFAPAGLAELDEAGLDEMFRTNFASALWTCQAAASRLAGAGGGSIVTVGSRTAIRGAGPVAHATSKAAVVRLTELLAAELRPSGVRVNAVLPSVIDTPANRSWMSEELAARAVDPTAIAEVIGFLCSEAARTVSGALVPVYGAA